MKQLEYIHSLLAVVSHDWISENLIFTNPDWTLEYRECPDSHLTMSASFL